MEQRSGKVYFSLFFSHFDIKAGKWPEDIVEEDIEREAREVVERKTERQKSESVPVFFFFCCCLFGFFFFVAPSLRKLSFSLLRLLAWGIVIL